MKIQPLLLLNSCCLLDDNQCVVFHDAFANFNADGSYLAGFLCLQVVGHLHGFEDNDGVAHLYIVANSYFDVGDDTGKGSLDGIVLVDIGCRSGRL